MYVGQYSLTEAVFVFVLRKLLKYFSIVFKRRQIATNKYYLKKCSSFLGLYT